MKILCNWIKLKKTTGIILPEITKTADNAELVIPNSSDSNFKNEKLPRVWNESQ